MFFCVVFCVVLRCVQPVQKTAEELKRQQERDAEERSKTIASRVPQLSIDGLDKGRPDWLFVDVMNVKDLFFFWKKNVIKAFCGGGEFKKNVSQLSPIFYRSLLTVLLQFVRGRPGPVLYPSTTLAVVGAGDPFA